MASDVGAVPSGERLARNQVSLLGAIMAGSVQVAPAFNVMFTVGLIAGTVGASVPLVMLLAGLGALTTGNSFSQFSRLQQLHSPQAALGSRRSHSDGRG